MHVLNIEMPPDPYKVWFTDQASEELELGIENMILGSDTGHRMIANVGFACGSALQVFFGESDREVIKGHLTANLHPLVKDVWCQAFELGYRDPQAKSGVVMRQERIA